MDLGCLKMKIGTGLTNFYISQIYFHSSRKEETKTTPNPLSPSLWLTSLEAQPTCGLSMALKLSVKYLFWWDPGAFPLVPPRLQHGYKAGEDDPRSQDAKNPCKALYVQGTSFLLRVHWGVQVTLAVLGPPFVLQDVHVTTLLKLQDPWGKAHNHVLLQT